MHSPEEPGALRPANVERLNACPVCNDRAYEPLYADLTDRVFENTPGTWTLCACHSCAAAFLNPRPSEEFAASLYRDYYTHSPDAGASRSGVRAARAVWLSVVASYQRGGAASRIPVIAQRAERSMFGANARAGHSPRVLDVGAGSGAFVQRARSLGIDAVGVDPDPAATTQAARAGVPVHTGSLYNLPKSIRDNRFDVIRLDHVIEHVRDPVGVLQQCRAQLEPDGEVMLATPNMDSLGHRRYGRDWMHLDVPRHLVLFTRRTLSVAFSRAGFAGVEIADRATSLGMEHATGERLRQGLSGRPRVGPWGSLRAFPWAAAHVRPEAEGSELLARARVAPPSG